MATSVLGSGYTFKAGLQDYAGALVAVSFALFIGIILRPLLGDSAFYIILFPAVAFSAWYCGIGPSVASVILALVGAKYWFIPPLYSFDIPNTAHSIRMLAFLLGSGLLVAAGEVRRRENEQLRTSQRTLEERVKERTAELDSTNQNLRELTARLLQLQDEERRRFARELHDSVGQVLAALMMHLSTVRADIERLTKTANILGQSEALVEEMSKEVRTISHLLHPPLLDEAGLASALRWYVDGFAERSNIKVELAFPDDFGRLSREVETAVFRVVQECLTNIHRHSDSPIAKISIARSADRILVEIEDRGKGMSPEKLVEMDSGGMPGVGIRGMRERIRQLGGRLDIKSGGNGTIVTVSLPIATTSSSAAA